jgi:hypothetical protein
VSRIGLASDLSSNRSIWKCTITIAQSDLSAAIILPTVENSVRPLTSEILLEANHFLPPFIIKIPAARSYEARADPFVFAEVYAVVLGSEWAVTAMLIEEERTVEVLTRRDGEVAFGAVRRTQSVASMYSSVFEVLKRVIFAMTLIPLLVRADLNLGRFLGKRPIDVGQERLTCRSGEGHSE